MSQSRNILVWVLLSTAIVIPIAAAALSPQLAWRGPIYIFSGFAGIVAMILLLVQPLLIGSYLPGLSPYRTRWGHRVIGSLLVVAVLAHVAGLWITSPPDVIDALMFRSPTHFSIWGVLAMWTAFATALLALLRRRLPLRLPVWRMSHTVLAVLTVMGSVVHAMLIEGTMETFSKGALCLLVVMVTTKLVMDLRLWSKKPG